MAKQFIVCVVALAIVGVYAPDPDCTKIPGDLDPDKCCKGPEVIDDDLEKKCGGDPKANLETTVCFMECVLNTTGIATNGALDEGKMKAYLTTKLGKDPAYMGLIEKAFIKCNGVAKEMAPKLVKTKCNPYSGALLGCVLRENWLECPPTNWQENPECNSIRGFMKACPITEILKA